MAAEFEADLINLAAAGKHTQAELDELFDVSRTSVYREQSATDR